ncbi:MAG: phosphoadenosine phosphosulfate reductase family protein [Oscillospiraceae bacterium]|nr:phosphoadenosine phosphosulfate reductase family protein [Oscillospiraceae bacterium]
MSLQHYKMPLIITDSGGKDSQVVKELALRSGIPFEIQHNHTTADAPETVRYIRQEAKRFEELGIQYTINLPVYKGKRTSMWNLIPQKLMPPTRLVRYCCAVLKEGGGAGRFIATGVRWAESPSRKNGRGIFEKNGDKNHRIILNNDNDDRRLLFENCRMRSKRTVNPIIDWKDADVWDYLESERVPCNPLYCEGWERVGCIGCPLAGAATQEAGFLRWPAYRNLYLQAFEKMLVERKRTVDANVQGDWVWRTAGDVMHWFLADGVLPGQIDLFEDYDLFDEE